jgi:hypothetical protein
MKEKIEEYLQAQLRESLSPFVGADTEAMVTKIAIDLQANEKLSIHLSPGALKEELEKKQPIPEVKQLLKEVSESFGKFMESLKS